MAATETPIDPDAFNRFEAMSWAERADGYHRLAAGLTTRVIEPLLDAADVDLGTYLLDVATGPGYVAGAAAARGADVVGVDVAAEMVSLARRLRPEIEFGQADAEKLPFADGSFDAAVANFLVPHVGRPEEVAAELARVVKPHGKVALSTWDVPERARLLGVLVDAVAEVGVEPTADIPAGPSFFRFSEEAEFVRLLGDAGLSDVAVRTVSFTHRLASADELWEGLMDGTVRMRALVRAQAEDVQARIHGVFDRLVSEYTTEEGSIELPVSVKLAAGRKTRG
jgi:ubiquinone/menaquinone biosynthesis C-methylase UbiE